MVGARTARVRILTSAVLAFLIALPVLQIPPIRSAGAPPKARTRVTMSCISCCGSNCQCAGDCCGDTHVETSAPAPPAWSAAERVSRDRECQRGGWLLPTATTSFQPWTRTPRTLRLRLTRMDFLESLEVVCLWRRPAVSQSNPRAPPIGSPSPIDRFIG